MAALNLHRSLDDIMSDLAVSSRNHALDAAAKVARLYGAPEEACERILMLKGPIKTEENV